MDFVFYYPAIFKGVDSTGTKQRLAFCGLMVDMSSGTSQAASLCGSMSDITQTTHRDPSTGV